MSSYLSRQAKMKKECAPSEEELKKKAAITPEDVLSLSGPTNSYLCELDANVYGIDFVRFHVRDMNSNATLFEVKKSADDKSAETSRFVKYLFPPQFLELATLGATIVFKIEGNEDGIKDFKMIERHFFKGKCLKTFEFDFGFCIPSSTNTCEHIYDMPKLTLEEKKEVVASPYETKSDSFYFVDGKLVMHHKAEYAYNAGH